MAAHYAFNMLAACRAAIISRYVLVNDWGVGRPVLIDYGHHESDEFWPEVQILYRWALFLSRNVLLPALQGEKSGQSG